MVEFSLARDMPNYAEKPVQEDSRIEEPIIPINELGLTVVENDPRTGAHILQNVEAAIRKGASTMQLVWSTPSNNPIGGRPKAYGKDVRRAIREMLDANEVNMAAFELPTSSNTNLSGFDPQRFTISEEKRQRDLQEVRDAIDFAVDVAGGGGVDIWSQEYVRSITDERKKINTNGKYEFYDYSPEELQYEKEVQEAVKKGESLEIDPKIEGVKYLYDKRTGQVLKDIKKSSVIQVPEYLKAKDINEGKYVGRFSEKKKKATGDGKIAKGDFVDLTGEWLNPNDDRDKILRVPEWDKEETRFKTKSLRWADIVRESQEYNKGKKEEKKITPEEMAFRIQLDNQILQARGQSLFYTQDYENKSSAIIKQQERYEKWQKEEEKVKKQFGNDWNDNVQKEWRRMFFEKEIIGDANRELVDKDALMQVAELAKDPEKMIRKNIQQLQHSLKHVHEASSSADARAEELVQMKNYVTTPDKLAKENTTDSYSELGIYAMEKSKDEKAKKGKPVYVGPELGWPTAYGGHPEEFIEIIQKSREKMAEKLVKDRGMKEEEAKEAARRHIRGDFDTSHMAMWYNHFAKKEGESEEGKLKRFNKWYLEMTDRLIKEDVVGSIQAVDSITGQHSHLPVGQGIFPIVDAVRKFKQKGWVGDIVSEGHEEEKFGQGRILTETWKAFGSPVGSSYFTGAAGPHTWRGIENSYFGATQPPTYIVGAYVPSNEWSLWSEVPFE